MKNTILYVLTFVLACSLSLYLTPLLRKAALQFGIVDKPDGKLKQQKAPVAYLGGLAVYLAFLISLALTFNFDKEVLGMLLAGTIVIVLGLIDDFGVLTPVIKLVGQSIAVLVLLRSGIYIKLEFLPWYVCFPLSFLWLLGITNAFNIIDVMDGLSSGVALVCSLILFTVGIWNERIIIAIMSIALGGSLLGFLRYNFEPAQIYLGDTGSMFIGMMIGSLAMIGCYTAHNLVACVAPVIILGVPLFDTMFVMYIRWRRGMPIIVGSPDHFALRLRKWRLSTTQTVMASYIIAVILGVSGLVMMQLPTNYGALVIILVLVTVSLLIAYFLKKIDMTL
jgi:UDP-GlcNAc:undecaprenyl-phosphate GlcNAc-1-phosphate transferase